LDETGRPNFHRLQHFQAEASRLCCRPPLHWRVTHLRFGLRSSEITNSGHQRC
jgi:hypothetical protein